MPSYTEILNFEWEDATERVINAWAHELYPPLPMRSFDVTRSQSRFLEKGKKIRTRSAPRQTSIAIAAGHKCGERAYISQNNTTHESFEHGQPRIQAIPTEPFGTHPWLLEVRKIPAHYVSFLTLYCPHRTFVHKPPA
jgi:hypothetical protein